MAIGQEKLSRLLKVISMLKTPHGRTISSMADELETSERTIYRYIDTLEGNGFCLDKSFSGERWFIVSDSNNEQDLLNFDIDEAVLLKDLLEQNAYNHSLKNGILQKLYINSELKPLANNIVEARINGIVNKLKRAVKSEFKVILKNYHSVNGNAIRDYLVEPYGFSPNYMAVYAYDINDEQSKQFRTCRIGDIQVLEKKQTNHSQHESFNLDAFGFKGDDNIEIILKLNHASVTKLRESFPQAYPFITKQGEDHYIFQGIINHVEGAGRFVLGHIDSVEIIKGEQLIEYLKEKLQHFNSGISPVYCS